MSKEERAESWTPRCPQLWWDGHAVDAEDESDGQNSATPVYANQQWGWCWQEGLGICASWCLGKCSSREPTTSRWYSERQDSQAVGTREICQQMAAFTPLGWDLGHHGLWVERAVQGWMLIPNGLCNWLGWTACLAGYKPRDLNKH